MKLEFASILYRKSFLNIETVATFLNRRAAQESQLPSYAK